MKIGILGGGQLARMLIEETCRYGIDFKILAKENNSSAGKITPDILVGDWNDEACLKEFVAGCDVITHENEFIDYKKIEFIEKLGVKVNPSSNVIRLIQDKLIQKQTIDNLNISVADYEEVNSTEDVKRVAEKYGYPVILKSRTMGYDGKGNYKIDSEKDISEGYKILAERGKLMCERYIPFESEIAVQAVRNSEGEIKIYPVVETIQENHICNLVKASRGMLKSAEKEVQGISEKLLKGLDYVGVLAVEMFLLKDGKILVNELAPRVHNSGHYTIEGCHTSQFENHIRAVLGLPLGSTELTSPSAVMINILGERNSKAEVKGVKNLLKLDNIYLHIYGKAETKPGRKMGHITVLRETTEDAVKIAEECRKMLDI